MFPTRFFQILFLVVAIGLATEASFIRDGGEVIRELVARQSGSDSNSAAASDTGSGSSPSTSAASVPTSKAESTSSSAQATSTKESSTSKADPTTSKSEPSTTSKADPTTSKNEVTSTSVQTSAAATTSAIQTSNIASTSAAQNPTTSSEEGSKTTSAPQSSDESKTTSFSQVVSTSYLTVTYTNSDGSQMVSTSAALTTSTVGLNGSNDAPSGLSDNNKKIIGGVVGGVGGAILLGALALVAWRIRARKKLAEENDGLMEYNGGYTPVDKVEPSSATLPSTTPGRSPFQSTLENYHQPSQPVNASSNF